LQIGGSVILRINKKAPSTRIKFPALRREKEKEEAYTAEKFISHKRAVALLIIFGVINDALRRIMNYIFAAVARIHVHARTLLSRVLRIFLSGAIENYL